MLLGPDAERMEKTRGWAEKLARVLIARQQEDGSWRNTAVDLREDDPLVATPLAASALAICRAMMGDRLQTAISM
jgi:hypothetical protein